MIRTTSLWWRQHLHLVSPAHSDWDGLMFEFMLSFRSLVHRSQRISEIQSSQQTMRLDLYFQWPKGERPGLILARSTTPPISRSTLAGAPRHALTNWCLWRSLATGCCTCGQVVYLSMSEDGAGHLALCKCASESSLSIRHTINTMNVVNPERRSADSRSFLRPA